MPYARERNARGASGGKSQAATDRNNRMAQADGNGESGTVSANNYVKGDSAVVCALPLESEQEIAAQVSVSFFHPSSLMSV